MAIIKTAKNITIEVTETYIVNAGKLIELANKINIDSTDEKLTLSTNKKVQIKGSDGVKHGKYKKVPIWMDPRCIIRFRPKNDWKGDNYGIDWMRTHDTKLKGDEAANTYKLISENYSKLRNEYQQRVFKRRDASNKEYTVTYFVPWLSLFPKNIIKNGKNEATAFSNTSAKLQLLIDVDTEPISIEIEYDEKLFQLDKKQLTTINKGKHEIELTINCLHEFDTDKEIKAVAVFKNIKGEEEKTLAGKIIVVKNKQRYKQKVVIVQVWTHLGIKQKKSQPVSRDLELKRYLRQALIEPSVISVFLKCDADLDKYGHITNLKTRFNQVANVSGGKIPNGATHAIQDFLNEELYKQYDKLGIDFRQSYKVYFINETAGDGTGNTLNGRSYGIPSPVRSVVVYNAGFNDSTLAHETLHAMGLFHSFDNHGKNVFTINTTDNIMDYSDVGPFKIPVVQLWKWQWEIPYNNVEKE